MLPNFLIVTKDGVDYGEGSDDAVLNKVVVISMKKYGLMFIESGTR